MNQAHAAATAPKDTHPPAEDIARSRAEQAAALRRMAHESDKTCAGLTFSSPHPGVALRAGADALEQLGREGELSAQVCLLLGFVAWFDAWADSAELCGGDLFDTMLAARDALRCTDSPAWRNPDEDPPPLQAVIIQWHDPVLGPGPHMELGDKRNGRWHICGEPQPLEQAIDGWQPLPSPRPAR